MEPQSPTVAAPPTIPPSTTSQAKKVDTRQTLRIAVLGRVGCGKSTISRKVTRSALEQHRRVLVVTSHDDEWLDFPVVHPRFPERIKKYVGGRRIVVHSRKAAYDAIGMFTHGLLVLDDCRRYLPTRQDDEVEELIISTRQKDVDLMVICHNFEQLPPVFFTFVDYFVMFSMRGNLMRRKDYFQDFDQVQKTVARINYAARRNPHYYEIMQNE